MSRSARWKEDRIRERIYLEQLKLSETESKEAASVTLEHSTRRPFSCLGRYMCVGLLRPVRNPLMMSLSKLKVKDHYNDYDDFVSATSR
jgi:hypothetical protein